jgi:hypothetical protein
MHGRRLSIATAVLMLISVLEAVVAAVLAMSEFRAPEYELEYTAEGGARSVLLLRGQVELATEEAGLVSILRLGGPGSPFVSITDTRWHLREVHDGWYPTRLLLPEFGRDESAPDSHRVVTTVPLWPVWLLAAVPTGVLWVRRARRGLRQRRGGCTRCGYDLGGITGTRCPECGAIRMGQ